MSRLTDAAGAVLDLLYPPSLYCICCGKIIDGSRIYRLCNDCMDGIKWTGAGTCRKCGKRLSDTNPSDICFSCREHPHMFRRGFTCTEYGTHERAVVFAMKYHGRADIAITAGEILADRMLAEFSAEELRAMYDIVLPVPIHPGKRSVRGYNQAALMAEEFCRRTGLMYDGDLLMRTRETHIMRSLGPDQRRENIRGAFCIRPRKRQTITGKRILIIDDIYTTGATVDEISDMLMRSGAVCADFLTFASGADMVKG